MANVEVEVNVEVVSQGLRLQTTVSVPFPLPIHAEMRRLSVVAVSQPPPCNFYLMDLFSPLATKIQATLYGARLAPAVSASEPDAIPLGL